MACPPLSNVRLDDLPAVWLPGDLRLAIATTRRARRRGLAGLRHMDADDALLLPRCRSVHTFGMRFAIDVVFLDGDWKTVDVACGVAPRRVVTCLRARAVLETAQGAAGRFLDAGLATLL